MLNVDSLEIFGTSLKNGSEATSASWYSSYEFGGVVSENSCAGTEELIATLGPFGVIPVLDVNGITGEIFPALLVGPLLTLEVLEELLVVAITATEGVVKS
jgi:hypothetical protein